MLEPIVVGTDGSPRADIAAEWAADEAARWGRPLHVVHAVEHHHGTLSDAGERILADGVGRAEKNHPELAVTGELIFEDPAYALRVAARGAFEMVLGHRGCGGFEGMPLGSTALRVAGHSSGPVAVVRGEPCERFQEVVVGVDESAGAAVALRYAFMAAAVRGAWIRAVHAWDLPERAYPVTVDRLSAVARERLAEAVAPWRERFPDVKVIEQAPSGHPVRELAERSARADLLVVGARGTSGPYGLFLGPVGHGVLHHARCTTAVVRPRPIRSRADRERGAWIGR